MWVITRAINQYDQDGDYLVAVYTEKPTRQELRVLLLPKGYDPETQPKSVRDPNEKFISHLLKGGGRQELENEWFYLTEIKSGEKYKNK